MKAEPGTEKSEQIHYQDSTGGSGPNDDILCAWHSIAYGTYTSTINLSDRYSKSAATAKREGSNW